MQLGMILIYHTQISIDFHSMSFCFPQNYCAAGFLDSLSAVFRVDLPVEKSLHFSLQMFLLAFCRAETQVKIFFNPYVK